MTAEADKSEQSVYLDIRKNKCDKIMLNFLLSLTIFHFLPLLMIK